MSKVAKEILQLLDSVVESKAAKDRLNQEASIANHEYRELLKSVAKSIEDKASKSDELADQFFTEQGILYKGQQFLFDDEGELIVCLGPLVIGDKA